MIRRTWHSYAYSLHLHFLVPLKSLLKCVVFWTGKSRICPEKLWISHWKWLVGQHLKQPGLMEAVTHGRGLHTKNI